VGDGEIGGERSERMLGSHRSGSDGPAIVWILSTVMRSAMVQKDGIDA